MYLTWVQVSIKEIICVGFSFFESREREPALVLQWRRKLQKGGILCERHLGGRWGAIVYS